MKNLKNCWSGCKCAIDTGHLGLNRTIWRKKDGEIGLSLLYNDAAYLPTLAHLYPARSYA